MRRLLVPFAALLLLGAGCENESVSAPVPFQAPVSVQAPIVQPPAASPTEEPSAAPPSAPAVVVPAAPMPPPLSGSLSAAQVTKVVDGDTLDILIDGKKDTVRFIGINAPELSSKDPIVLCQAQAAQKAAAEEIGASGVTLQNDDSQYDRDKYERLLRYIILPDGTNLNEWMVKEGYAYEYTYEVPYEYQARFKADQNDAEANKRGLWGDLCAPAAAPAPAPTSTAQPTPTQPAPAPTTSGFTCAGKTLCGQMTSCAEARFYLTQCGVARLDGDHDGTPCESLCK